MISPKTRRNLIVAILILLILLIAFLLWWFLRPKAVEPIEVPVVPVETVEPSGDKETITDIQDRERQEERNATASLQSASKTFAERYGSYSTEAEFGNLRDVLPLMSESLASQTQRFIDMATPAAEYYAVTTRVISVSVDAEDEAAATASVTVTAQREEAKGSIQNISVRYQDLKLTFVREDGSWKVSSATWQ